MLAANAVDIYHNMKADRIRNIAESVDILLKSRARKNASRVYQRSVLTSSDPIVVALRENSRPKLFQVKKLEKVCVAT